MTTETSLRDGLTSMTAGLGTIRDKGALLFRLGGRRKAIKWQGGRSLREEVCKYFLK